MSTTTICVFRPRSTVKVEFDSCLLNGAGKFHWPDYDSKHHNSIQPFSEEEKRALESTVKNKITTNVTMGRFLRVGDHINWRPRLWDGVSWGKVHGKVAFHFHQS